MQPCRRLCARVGDWLLFNLPSKDCPTALLQAAAPAAAHLANDWQVPDPLAQLVLVALQQLGGGHVVTNHRRLAGAWAGGTTNNRSSSSSSNSPLNEALEAAHASGPHLCGSGPCPVSVVKAPRRHLVGRWRHNRTRAASPAGGAQKHVKQNNRPGRLSPQWWQPSLLKMRASSRLTLGAAYASLLSARAGMDSKASAPGLVRSLGMTLLKRPPSAWKDVRVWVGVCVCVRLWTCERGGRRGGGSGG